MARAGTPVRPVAASKAAPKAASKAASKTASKHWAKAAAAAQAADGDLLAAVDLGSNSFHMVVARAVLGQLRIVDRIKENVRLAAGLDNRELGAEAMRRAEDCLQRFGQRLAHIPDRRVRAIATNTVRQLAQAQDFLVPAEAALGHAIEVVSGREEARLIWLGVAHGNPPGERSRLVIDIGGGSTEFIVGAGFEALERESLQMGCIATTRRFFSDGRISGARWKEARTEITAEFQQFSSTFRHLGWEEAYGSSGTIKAIGDVAVAMKLGREGSVGAAALDAIRQRLLGFSRIEDIRLPGLPADRRPVIAGGLLILDAVFAELGLKSMHVSENALREGALYDILGRDTGNDPRESSIEALVARYDVDRAQAARVAETAYSLFDQLARDWQLNQEDRRLLGWAAEVHELGLAIAHSQHHQHGAYLVENSDIAGFSRAEQQFIAALVRNQRRGLDLGTIHGLPDRMATAALHCALVLRLAVLLHRSHDRTQIPILSAKALDDGIRLTVARKWLADNPLTEADLSTEKDYLAERDLRLELKAT
jgi:exopolyphosphatase/guanosine-5'-triphosphate,3'-diphosphate pyrophosphatase